LLTLIIVIISEAVCWVGSFRRSSRLAVGEGEGCRGGITSSDAESFGSRDGETTHPARCN